jgi:hypothetical protein
MVPAPRTAARLIKNGWVVGEVLMKPSILMRNDVMKAKKIDKRNRTKNRAVGVGGSRALHAADALLAQRLLRLRFWFPTLSAEKAERMGHGIAWIG